MIKAFIITLMKDAWSLSYAERCLQSIQDTESDIEATLFNATTPETIFPVAWTWPSGKKITCEKTNLFLKSGVYKDFAKRFLDPSQIDDIDISLHIQPLDVPED